MPLLILTILCVSIITKRLLVGIKLELLHLLQAFYTGYVSVLCCILTCFLGQILLLLFTLLALLLSGGSIPRSIESESCPSELFCKWYPQLMDLASFQINLKIRLLEIHVTENEETHESAKLLRNSQLNTRLCWVVAFLNLKRTTAENTSAVSSSLSSSRWDCWYNERRGNEEEKGRCLHREN